MRGSGGRCARTRGGQGSATLKEPGLTRGFRDPSRRNPTLKEISAPARGPASHQAFGASGANLRYGWKADVRRGKRQACYDHGCPQRRHQFNVPDTFKSSRRSVLFGAAFSSSTWLKRKGRPRRRFRVGRLNSLRIPWCLALLDSHWEAPHHSCSASAFFCEEKTLQRNK